LLCVDDDVQDAAKCLAAGARLVPPHQVVEELVAVPLIHERGDGLIPQIGARSRPEPAKQHRRCGTADRTGVGRVAPPLRPRYICVLIVKAVKDISQHREMLPPRILLPRT
jgi:hypothetical protein